MSHFSMAAGPMENPPSTSIGASAAKISYEEIIALVRDCFAGGRRCTTSDLRDLGIRGGNAHLPGLIKRARAA